MINIVFNKLILQENAVPNYEAAALFFDLLQTRAAQRHTDQAELARLVMHCVPLEAGGKTLAQIVNQRGFQFYLQDTLREQDEQSNSSQYKCFGLKATLTKFLLHLVDQRLQEVIYKNSIPTTQAGYFKKTAPITIPMCLRDIVGIKQKKIMEYSEEQLNDIFDNKLQNAKFELNNNEKALSAMCEEIKKAVNEIIKHVQAKQSYEKQVDSDSSSENNSNATQPESITRPRSLSL